MKTPSLRMAQLLTVMFCLSFSSCTMHPKHHDKHDNGKHKGWFKNPNNPHHPNSTNPGKSKGKSSETPKGNSKGKSNK
ncbi:MAG: hypothetical protein ACHQF2_03680 [Flavobacteriales bacterium]